jgi:peptide/nickel transport system permease protein
MLSYIIRRILATVPVMVVVALFVSSLLYIAPGDPAAVIAGDQATPADVERIRDSVGLDRPFLIRFGEWFWQILHGDLGTSIFTNLTVAAVIAQRVEPTLSLMAVTLAIAVCVAVPIGVVAAWQADTLIDRAIMAFAVLGFSVPVFVVGYLLAYVFALELDWLPVQGYTQISEGVWPWLENLILPALALGCVYNALIARITRAAMLEVLQQDFIRTAAAASRAQRQGGRAMRGRNARPCWYRRADPTCARVPAPIVRWHAPARDDRHCAGLQTEAPHRRRADHRARRHHPGADTQSHGRPQAAGRCRDYPHHP